MFSRKKWKSRCHHNFPDYQKFFLVDTQQVTPNLRKGHFKWIDAKSQCYNSVSSLHFHGKSEKKVFPYFSSTMKYSTSRITMTQSQRLWSIVDQFFCFVQIIHYDIIKRERCNFNFPLYLFFRLKYIFDYCQRVEGKRKKSGHTFMSRFVRLTVKWSYLISV